MRFISAIGKFHAEVVLNGSISERNTSDVERYKTTFQERLGIPKSASNLIGVGEGSVVLVFQLPLRWPRGGYGDGNAEIDVMDRLIEDVSQRADWLMDDDVIGIHIEGQDYVDLAVVAVNPVNGMYLAFSLYL